MSAEIESSIAGLSVSDDADLNAPAIELSEEEEARAIALFAGPPAQRPYALWIGCSDSRIPESVLVGAQTGRIFVHRNIGNQVDPRDNTSGALTAVEYAVRALNVGRIFVVGHSDCGAVQFSILSAQGQNNAQSRFPFVTRYLQTLTSIARHVIPGSPPGRERELNVARQNVKDQVANIVRSRLNIAANGQRVPVKGYVYHIGRPKPWEGVIQLMSRGLRGGDKAEDKDLNDEEWVLREIEEYEEEVEI